MNRITHQILAAIALAAMIGSSSAQSHTVAITVDDLPFVSVGGAPAEVPAKASAANRKLLSSFRRHHVPVTGFVNEKWVEEIPSGRAILRSWVAAGLDLGNHTWSHRDFDDLSIEQFEDEVLRGEGTLIPAMQAAGRSSKFFRFPFNHTGDTTEKHQAAATFLAAHGYMQAPCTIENSDYLFNAVYEKMLSRHDRAGEARLRADYLAFTEAQIDYFDRLNRQVLGYDAPQIMLIHDNRLNADVIERFLSAFESKHYAFIPLSQAEADPVYRHGDTFVTKFGPMWGYRWARERGVKVDGRLEQEPPQWITEYLQNPQPPRRVRSSF